jgi:hypothetical protein
MSLPTCDEEIWIRHFAWLPKMIDERNWFAFQLRVNPILDPLRDDPRFVDLMRRRHFWP